MGIDSSMLEVMEGLADSSATALSMSYSAFNNLLSIAIYIFTSLALFTIARRRFVPHAWLAWIPFAQFWIVGSISDNYHWSVHHQIKKKRKVLLVLYILMIICVVVLIAGMFKMLIAVINAGITSDAQIEEMLNMISSGDPGRYEDLLAEFLSSLGMMFLSLLVMLPVSIIYVIFYYMALYGLYRSCTPENAGVYLALSILFSFTLPIFLMICRNKDQGMHPTYSYNFPQNS